MKPVQWLGVVIVGGSLAVSMAPNLVKGLGGLSGVATAATGSEPVLAQFYADLATINDSGGCLTTGQWRTMYRRSVELMQKDNRFTGWAKYDADTSAAIATAIGMADVEMTPDLRAKLSAALRERSKFFGTATPPPQ